MNPDLEILDLIALAESIKLQIQTRLGPQGAPLVEPVGRLSRKLLGLKNALASAGPRRPKRRPAPVGTFDEKFEGTLGSGPELDELRRVVVRVATRNVPVLIEGESGTGKELLARVVHALSPRHGKPFLALNCGAFPPHLLESELFGHVAGAYTGARADRRGAFQAADGGTLFLDELGELPPEAQSRFLRVLQSGDIQKLGSDQVEAVDVRIVAATNRNLLDEVAAGRFRLDLYYRLTVVAVHLPPLRSRADEIPGLVDHFVERFGRELDCPDVRGLAPEAMEFLRRHDFPGNIRQLENMVKRGVLLAEGEWIGTADLVGARPTVGPAPAAGRLGEVPRTADELREAREEVIGRLETAFLDDCLRRAGGRVADAARLTGMNRSQLHQMIKRRDVDPARYKPTGGEEDDS